MELVISISRVTRFARVGGNALGVKLPTTISHQSKANIPNNEPAGPSQAAEQSRYRLSKQQAAEVVVQVKKRPRLLMHIGMSLAVVAIVIVGGLNAAGSNQTASDSQVAGPLSALADQTGYGGVADETASAYIAAGVAEEIDLPLAEEVAKTVQALSTKVNYGSIDDNYLTKPQLVSTEGALATGIQKYIVKAGDTVDSIAAGFNISANTVRWANNIAEGSQPATGQELTILPVSGVLHTVSETDTPQGLALVYQTSAELIISFNDAEVDGLQPGSKIIIPGGVIAPSPSTPSASFAAGSGSYIINSAFQPSYSGNGYDYGWCTWHAANRRASSGRPIPSNWGNAIGWKYNAAASGYAVGSTPQPGAVVYHNNIGGWGHVAYVERVTSKGAWVSDMNFPIWGGVTERYVPASEYGNYSFIY